MTENSEVVQLLEEIKKWREKVQLYEAWAEEAQNETLEREPKKIGADKRRARISDEGLLNEINLASCELNEKVIELEGIKVDSDELDVFKQEFTRLLEKNHECQEEVNNLLDVDAELRDRIYQLNLEIQEETQTINHTLEMLADIEFQIQQMESRRRDLKTSLQDIKMLLLEKEEEEVMLNNELLNTQALSVELKSLFKEVDDKCHEAKTKLELYMNKYSDCKIAIESKMLLLSTLKNKVSVLKSNTSSAASENGKIFVDALEIRIKDLELILTILDRWSRNGKEIKVDPSFNQFYEIENLISKHKEMQRTLLDALKTLKGRQLFSVIEDAQEKLEELRKTYASLKAELLSMDFHEIDTSFS